MTTYGPITGITKDALFDTIVNNIDATLSGNSTGWNLIKDGRDSTRVPTADGLSSISKPLPTAYTNTNLNTTNITSSTKFLPSVIFRNGATYYAVVAFSTTSKALLTSVDGETWSADNTNFVPMNVGNTYFYTPTPMADGKNWVHIILSSNNTSGSLTLEYPATYTSETDMSSTRATATSSNGVSVPTGSYGESFNGFLPHMYAIKHSNTKASFFAPSNTGSTLVRHTLEGNTYTEAFTNFDNETTPNAFQPVITNTELACLRIRGVVLIDSIRTDLHRVVVRVDQTASESRYKQFYIENEIHPAVNETYAITNITDLGVDNTNIYMQSPQANFGVNILYNVDNLYTSTAPTDASVQVKASSESGGDAIPDVKGVEYEYCVLESDNAGEQFIIAQVNPEAAQPSVTGLTDTLPILVRPVENFDVANNTVNAFYFDPVNATDQVAIAPAVLSVPDVLADPEETFRYWMKVNARQVFFYCESTNGTNQHFHVNIPDKVIPYDASNIVVMSSGTLTGTGGVMLKGLGASATLDLRGDSKQYYPRAMEITYSTLLTDTNAVDSKDVSTDVFAVSNVSAFGVAPSANLFVAGRLYDTKYPTNNSGLSSGDEDTILSSTYKFFRTDTTAANDNPTTVKPLMIKWV